MLLGGRRLEARLRLGLLVVRRGLRDSVRIWLLLLMKIGGGSTVMGLGEGGGLLGGEEACS